MVIEGERVHYTVFKRSNALASLFSSRISDPHPRPIPSHHAPNRKPPSAFPSHSHHIRVVDGRKAASACARIGSCLLCLHSSGSYFPFGLNGSPQCGQFCARTWPHAGHATQLALSDAPHSGKSPARSSLYLFKSFMVVNRHFFQEKTRCAIRASSPHSAYELPRASLAR